MFPVFDFVVLITNMALSDGEATTSLTSQAVMSSRENHASASVQDKHITVHSKF